MTANEYLLHVQRSAQSSDSPLMARPFDPTSGSFEGPAFQVLDGQYFTGSLCYGAGTLIWLDSSRNLPATLEWYCLDGALLGRVDWTGNGQLARISPDGKRIALDLEPELEIWTIDVETGTPTQLTFAGMDRWPEWSPGSRTVFFQRSPPGESPRIMKRAADGSTPTEPAFGEEEIGFTLGASPEADWLAWGHEGGLRLRSFSSERTVELSVDSFASWPYPSPEGRYVTCRQLGQRGEEAIVVRAIEGTGEWVFSEADDVAPALPSFSADGRFLYYTSTVAGARVLRRVELAFDPTPRRVSHAVTVLTARSEFNYDLHPDGERILVRQAVESLRNDHTIHAIFDFDEYLEQWAPAR